MNSFAALAPADVDDEGRACLALPSYLFKYFPNPQGTGFDYLPRFLRQTTLFRPRPGLRQGTGRVEVTSSPFDPLGDIPVLGDPLLAIHGRWDNTMLPGEVLAREWRVWRFLKHAFFKDDMTPALLASAAPHATPHHGRIAHSE